MLTSSWFVERCKEITKQNKNIWIAYSGGVDSLVLLHLAATSFANVQAIHINDGLSPNTDAWQQHCTEVCEHLQVKLHNFKVNAEANPGQSSEDAARIARRTTWQNFLCADDVLLLAHHAGDQAETILYRLFRGAGPKGLSGMQMHSKLGEVELFRPFLTIDKSVLLNYAQKHNLTWIADETNSDINFDRNFIRQQVMPILTSRWPAVISSINRAGRLNAQLIDCLEPMIAQKLSATLGANNTELDLLKLQAETTVWRVEILRAWLQALGVTPSSQQLQLIIAEVIEARIDANPKFKLASKIIRRSKNKLYCLDDTQASQTFAVEWDMSADLSLPNGEILTVGQIKELNLDVEIVVVKMGIYGDKVKKLFQQYSIPPWERHNYPIVFAAGRLLVVIGLPLKN